MSGMGLVLSGGGAKGVYQVGVWRALCEFGYNNYIDIYSGSSIGAINSFLIQTMDWKEATNIWLNNDLSKVFFTDGVDSESLAKTIRQILFGKEIQFDSLFTRDGFVELLNAIGLERLEGTTLDTYVTVANVTEIPEEARTLRTAMNWYEGRKSGFTQYVHMRKPETNFIKDILLATSAIPIIYPPEKIGDQYYVDGGINDPLPVYPLNERGVNTIIAVSCDKINYQALKRKYPFMDILLIYPSRNIGNLFNGTLNFDNRKLKDTYYLGYSDGKKAIKKIDVVLSSERQRSRQGTFGRTTGLFCTNRH